jgi:hypothetical protein
VFVKHHRHRTLRIFLSFIVTRLGLKENLQFFINCLCLLIVVM